MRTQLSSRAVQMQTAFSLPMSRPDQPKASRALHRAQQVQGGKRHSPRRAPPCAASSYLRFRGWKATRSDLCFRKTSLCVTDWRRQTLEMFSTMLSFHKSALNPLQTRPTVSSILTAPHQEGCLSMSPVGGGVATPLQREAV